MTAAMVSESTLSRVLSPSIQGKPFHFTVIQVYAPITDAREAEVEWFYEDLQHLLKLIPKKISYDVQKLLRLIRSHLFIFAFISNILEATDKQLISRI